MLKALAPGAQAQQLNPEFQFTRGAKHPSFLYLSAIYIHYRTDQGYVEMNVLCIQCAMGCIKVSKSYSQSHDTLHEITQ